VRGEARGVQLGEHLRRVLERALEVVRVLHPPNHRSGQVSLLVLGIGRLMVLGFSIWGRGGAYEGAVHVELYNTQHTQSS
jgi:hypothetical protein